MNKKRRKISYFILSIIIIAVATALIFNYVKNKPQIKYTFNQETNEGIKYPDTSFAVISDLHFYDNSLGITGSAFEECLNSDRKLLKDSSKLVNYAIDEIIKSKVKFVLISGDLTKDGELINHQKVAEALTRLTNSGIKVCVAPGNHDVNNPLSYKYIGDKTELVPNVGYVDFPKIYGEFGYDNAIYRDTNSLSYVSEPVENLWIVALDTCRSEENEIGKEEIVGGKITQEQENWLNTVLIDANKNKKAVIVLQHHGVVEHWTGQAKLHPDYLVKDYKYYGEMLSSYNVKLAFTGHYHAQDIVKGDFKDNGYLYDIETGSLITAPCPIRYCSINNNKLTIKSEVIVDKIYPNTEFAKQANQFVFDTIFLEAKKTLLKYRVSQNDAQLIADAVGYAFAAHYKGDENISDKIELDKSKLSIWGKVVYGAQKYVIDGLWKELFPKDNDVILDL